MLAISFPHCLDYFTSKCRSLWHLDSGSRFRQRCLHWCIPVGSKLEPCQLRLLYISELSDITWVCLISVFPSLFLLPLSIQSFRLQDLQLSFFFYVFLVSLIQWFELALGIIGLCLGAVISFSF
ncbi:hypothetical protein C8J56DRAFT_333824 [Mycena floridula]|nr:hypothetical protein C8J56DRAFT_333824 [Mycena floridula]